MTDIHTGFTVAGPMSVDAAAERAAASGADLVELLLDGPHARNRVDAEAVRSALATHDRRLVVHLPFGVALTSPHEHVRAGLRREFAATIECAADLGAEKAVVHPTADAWDLGWGAEALREHVAASVDDLARTADDHGVELCVENVLDGPVPLDGLPELVAGTPAGITFDVSHALLAGHDEAEQASFLETHRKSVSHLHLADTRGTDDDEHLPLGVGTTDWRTALDPLRSGWNGTITLEIGTLDLDHIVDSVERLDAFLSS